MDEFFVILNKVKRKYDFLKLEQRKFLLFDITYLEKDKRYEIDVYLCNDLKPFGCSEIGIKCKINQIKAFAETEANGYLKHITHMSDQISGFQVEKDGIPIEILFKIPKK